MSGSMVDIQSPTLRLGEEIKKEEERKKRDENIHGLPYYIYGDHKTVTYCLVFENQRILNAPVIALFKLIKHYYFHSAKS